MTPHRLKLRLRNQLSEADRLHRELENFANRAGLSKKELNRLNLSIEELFANVVNYGYHDTEVHWIEITIALDNGYLSVEMIDDGRPFNPMTRAAPDTLCPLENRGVGGLGIHLCRNLMDEMSYERQGMRNIVTLKRKIGG